MALRCSSLWFAIHCCTSSTAEYSQSSTVPLSPNLASTKSTRAPRAPRPNETLRTRHCSPSSTNSARFQLGVEPRDVALVVLDAVRRQLRRLRLRPDAACTPSSSSRSKRSASAARPRRRRRPRRPADGRRRRDAARAPPREPHAAHGARPLRQRSAPPARELGQSSSSFSWGCGSRRGGRGGRGRRCSAALAEIRTQRLTSSIFHEVDCRSPDGTVRYGAAPHRRELARGLLFHRL